MTIEGFDKDTIKSALKALVSAVEDFDVDESLSSVESQCQPLLNLFSGKSEVFGRDMSSKKYEAFLLSVIREHSKASVRRFFRGLHSIVDCVVSDECYVPESAFEHDPDDDERDEATKTANNRQAKTCLHFLRYAALCAAASLEGRIEQKNGPSQVQVAPEVYDVALKLHNSLLSIHDCGEEAVGACNAILLLCEEWWLSNAINRDTLIAQVLPLLVLQASDPVGFQKSHIIKLLSFKDAFQVIDFLNPSSDSLRTLLLKVASNPLCLRLGEGRKFLASLFRDPDLVSDLHLAFRAQIPQAPKSILDAYGEIYFKAWCAAEEALQEETKEVLEHQALQDLMHCAIHVAAPAMAKNILTVLAPVHMEKKTKRVADLLYRLYSPILWRSLTAANPIVRKHAIDVLDQVFPLHDPNNSQMKVAIEKCTQALKVTLQDVDPKVRVAASQAVANICCLFWDALSTSDIRMILNHAVLDHSSDATSAAVREQALLTTANLLEIPQSHAVLRPLLPSLGNLVHDKKEKVRLAAVKLLRRVKQTRGIHFYHVVPVEHLCARLSEEAAHRDPKSVVNKELTALMLSSYFPQGADVTAGDQIQRTIAFLLTDPLAAASFYANLADFLEVESVAKFIVMLLACVKSAVQTDQAEHAKRIATKKKRRRANAPPDDQDTNSQKLSATNTDLMVGLVETIHTLLTAVSSALDEPDNKPSRKLVHDRIREADLLNALTHFEQRGNDSQSATGGERAQLDKNFRICRAILGCIAFVPKKIIPGVEDFIADSLRGIARDENISPSYALSHLALLARWGLEGDIASALASSIETGVKDGLNLTLLSPTARHGSNGDQLKPGNRKKIFGQTSAALLPQFSARVALEILHVVLSGNDACALYIRGKILASSDARTAIDEVLRKALQFAERILSTQPVYDDSLHDVDAHLILGCCEIYGRLALHLSCQEGQLQLTNELERIVDWTTEHVLPVLTGATALVETDLHGLDLSRISNVSDSLTNTHGLMSPPKQRMNLGPQSSRLSELSQNSAFSSTPPAEHFAQLLMQSALLIVSEFLVIGGPADARLVSKVSGWVSIVGYSSDSDRIGKIKSHLLPGFVRLGLLVSKKAQNFTLLHEIIMKCGSELTEGVPLEMLKQAVKSLLPTGLQKESPFIGDLADSIRCTAGSCPDLLVEEFQAVTSANEVLPGTCLGAVLETCAKNSKACASLADKLLSKILSHRGDTSSDVVLHGRCLSFLVASMQSESFNEKLVEEMSNERPQFEEIRNMLGKIVYVGAH